MNIMEETTGTYRVRIEGMTMRQIKDIFEDKWGALMWANGGAYPAEDVQLQFIKESRIEADEALMRRMLEALDAMYFESNGHRSGRLEQWKHAMFLTQSVLDDTDALRKRLESSK